MWRNTGQPVRIFMLDARACLPILCAAVYWSWPTLYIAITGFAGLTLPALWRVVRRWLVGRTRTAVPVWKRRRLA
jgi:intracellular multiplication protein IcmT